MNTYKINRMPEPTWSWLKVNTTEIQIPDMVSEQQQVPIVCSENIIVKPFTNIFLIKEDPSAYIMNEESDKLFSEKTTQRYHITIPENHIENQPIIIDFHMKNQDDMLVEDIVIEALEASESTIIIKYTSEQEYEQSHLGRLRIIVKKNAKCKIIKAQLFEHKVKHQDYFGAWVESKGELSVLQPEIGAEDIVSAWNIILDGEESIANLDILYVGDGTKRLDFNSRIELRGERSFTKVRAKGVLNGKSSKTFRDSLDFKSGAKGAKGREEESVLMLSKTVHNISVPLLFCGEDDVEGEHAASSGRPDEATMLYLMSRGFDETEARKLLSEAIFTAILDAMNQEALKDEILTVVRNSIKGGK